MAARASKSAAPAVKAPLENLLAKVPHLTCEWEQAEGLVAIKAPRFKSRLGRAFCRLIGVSPTFYVRLRDPLARAAFQLIDGRRTVGEIAAAWADRFPKEVQPRERLVEFLAIFERNRWIKYDSGSRP